MIGFAGSVASAVMLPNGGFVPQQCGPQTIDTAHKNTHVMESACVGYLAGTTTRAVVFTLSDDSTHLFRVTGQSNLFIALESGASMSIFRLVGDDGQEIAMKAIVNKDGSVKSISGEFQTNSYLVPAFQQMLTMM